MHSDPLSQPAIPRHVASTQTPRHAAAAGRRNRGRVLLLPGLSGVRPPIFARNALPQQESKPKPKPKPKFCRDAKAKSAEPAAQRGGESPNVSVGSAMLQRCSALLQAHTTNRHPTHTQTQTQTHPTPTSMPATTPTPSHSHSRLRQRCRRAPPQRSKSTAAPRRRRARPPRSWRRCRGCGRPRLCSWTCCVVLSWSGVRVYV